MNIFYLVIAATFVLSCGRSNEGTPAELSAIQPTGQAHFAWQGQFSQQFNWPIIPLHAVLTPDGKVFSYGTTNDGTQSGQFNYDVWNSSSGTGDSSHQWMPNTTKTDIFCSAAALLPSGNVLVPGGDTRNPINFGIKSTLILNNANKTLSPTAQMAFARWYPTATTLPNGETLIHGGKDGVGAAVSVPEVFSNGQWRSLWGGNNQEITTNNDGRWNYPRNWVAPNGRVFGVSGGLMYFLDWGGNGGNQLAGNIPNKTRGYVSTAVMYQPGKILQVGGTVNGDVGARGSNQAITIDVTSGWPQLADLPDMAKARIWGNSTVLPNGEVLITGGSAWENKVVEPAQTAEIWNPYTRQFRQVATAATPRLYHSIALLLPDATVLTGGGGAPGPLNNLNGEIYYPPYLYDGNGNKATRPLISAIGNALKYNDVYTLNFASASAISRVTLIRTGAVTHSFDMSQRFLELSFTQRSNGQIDVRMPNNANVAPPGYYMIFILDQKGTPSVAKIVAVNGSGGSPTAGVISTPVPAPGAVIAAGNVRLSDVLTVTNRNSGLCLDVPASSVENSVKLQQYTCNGTNAQKFRVIQGLNGAYQLQNLASSRCLDISSAGLSDGALVQQYDCYEGAPSRSFRFVASVDNSSRVQSAHSSKCIEVFGASKINGALVQQYGCGARPQADWFLKK